MDEFQTLNPVELILLMIMFLLFIVFVIYSCCRELMKKEGQDIEGGQPSNVRQPSLTRSLPQTGNARQPPLPRSLPQPSNARQPTLPRSLPQPGNARQPTPLPRSLSQSGNARQPPLLLHRMSLPRVLKGTIITFTYKKRETGEASEDCPICLRKLGGWRSM